MDSDIDGVCFPQNFHCIIPKYLSDLLVTYKPSHSLRAESQCLLKIPPSRSNYGDRAFSVIGPKLWNNLPNEIKQCNSVISFKTALKTYLFGNVYKK